MVVGVSLEYMYLCVGVRGSLVSKHGRVCGSVAFGEAFEEEGKEGRGTGTIGGDQRH
jgi:K+-transporting ATPase c subunit